MKSYRYVDGEYEIRQEIKRSVFIATVKGELDADSAEEFVKSVRRRYPDATHNCYAYVSDELGNATRFSDDKEPGGTAGQPILEVLKRQELRRTGIVVTRYFGGIKLGAGGLVGAYSGAAAEAVKAAKIRVKQMCALVTIACDYSDFALIDKLVRQSRCALDSAEYGDGVLAKIFVATDDVDKFEGDAREATAGRAKVTRSDICEYVNIDS